jgi:putative transposase
MRYRRARHPGGIYFFTVVTAERRPVFASVEAVEALRESLRDVAASRPFAILAYALMPDHFHCIWRLPEGDSDFSTRWRLIKLAMTRKLKKRVWQQRFWEHLIRDEADFERHMDYIHFNPVKHGLTKDACAWPHSSLAAYVAKGVYPRGWGTQYAEPEGAFGE